MNHLYVADCLNVLRGKKSDIVDLIYLDPPFNSKRDYNLSFTGSEAQEKKFQDTWNWTESLHAEKDDIRNSGHPVWKLILPHVESNRGPYLTFMTSRLIELHRVLKSTGTLYLHCDPTMSHYLKIVLDSIFGDPAFRNEIVWSYALGGSGKMDFSRKHDIILRYTKSRNWVFHKPQELATSSSCLKYGTMKGMRDVWYYTMGNKDLERVGYPTQKPIKLLERIIKASSNEGDLVLDPFCGSSTTLIAAAKLKRNWVGIDVSHSARGLLDFRLHKEGIKDKYVLHGIPEDWRSAKQLSEENVTEFKHWAISELRRQLTGLSPVKHESHELYYHLYFRTTAQVDGTILVRIVKKASVEQVHRMRADITDKEAKGGIIVTLHDAVNDVSEAALRVGRYKTQSGVYSKVQIVSIKDMLQGKLPRIPSAVSDTLFNEELPSNVISIKRLKGNDSSY